MILGIIGAGPAGLTMAITAKRNNPELSVMVFEKLSSPGKKILASGNGKANISNLNISEKFYNTDYFDFFDFSIKSFCDSLGLLIKSDKEGRVYPYNERANDVLDSLILTAQTLKISIIYEEVLDVNGCFEIKTRGKKYQVDYLAIATGGKSQEQLGSSGFGYGIAVKYGHTITNLKPGLCPLKSGKPYKDLSGIRAKCHMKVYGDELLYEDDGELLFKDEGISGIISFQASSIMARNKYGFVIVDFLHDVSDEEIFKYLDKQSKDRYVDQAFLGMVDKGVLKRILDDKGIQYKGKKIGDVDAIKIIYALRNYHIDISGPYGFKLSQVTIGGVNNNEINQNFESKKQAKLYIIGETLDVDGLSGGYNLNFAFASGYKAGESIDLSK